MQFTSISSLLALSSIFAYTSALGINCRGNTFCTKDGYPEQLQGFINDIQCDRIYKNGEHIACVSKTIAGNKQGGICAFLQGTQSGASGASIQLMMQAIIDHGCKGCGSSPVTFPQLLGNNNNPDAGILTINVVSDTDNPCPTGLC